ncbi:MAG TPA: LptF/LptG family permease [bacterium]|nr:LptF/LptG family permease [bacterium]
MGLLDRYVWKQLLGVFGFGVAFFTAFLLVNHLFVLARLNREAGFSFVLLQLAAYRLPYFAVYSLPMATLLASLLAVGRLSDGQEITAMRTSGVSLRRIAVPMVIAGLAISVAAILTGEFIVPRAEEAYRQALARTLRSQRNIQRLLFRDVHDGTESAYFVRRFRPADGQMEDVVVNQIEQGTLKRVIEAARATYRDGEWLFEDGTLHVFSGDTTVTSRFDRLRLQLSRTPREIAAEQRDPSEMTISELRTYVRLLERSRQPLLPYQVEIQSKLALPFSAALFALLALPLGLRPHRSGRAIGLGLTVAVLIVYYVLISITVTLGLNGRLSPVAAAWLPNLALAAAGVALLWRADR